MAAGPTPPPMPSIGRSPSDTARLPLSPPSPPVATAVPRLRWRYFRSQQGHDPVRSYLETLSRGDRAVVKAQMKRVRENPRAARHLRGQLFEVRASREGRAHRVLFVREARAKQVLLAVDAFRKTTGRTPATRLRVAEDRARAWRELGRGVTVDAKRPSVSRTSAKRLSVTRGRVEPGRTRDPRDTGRQR